MPYTIEQLLVFVLFAGLSGFLFARFLEARSGARHAVERQRWIDDVEGSRRAAVDGRQAALGEAAHLRAEATHLRAEAAHLRAELAAARDRADSLEKRLHTSERACTALREERDAFRRRADEAERRPVAPVPQPRLPIPVADPLDRPRVPSQPRPQTASRPAPAPDPTPVGAPSTERSAPDAAASNGVGWPRRPVTVPAARAVARRSGIALPALPARPRRRRLPPIGGGAPVDDLECIRGVGPATARRLRELGYRTYRDLMGWTPDVVERLVGDLGAVGRRIERDDWIGQARALEAQKPGR